jgi:TonB family protein
MAIRYAAAALLLLGPLMAAAQTTPRTVTQEDIDAGQKALQSALTSGAAAKSTAGADFRGRTAAQDIADWTMQPAVKQRLDELIGEQDATARGAAITILADQMRRIVLINHYWNTWPLLKRERDLWDKWVQLVLPQTSATDSVQRVKAREAEFAKTYVPGTDPAVLDADMQSLLTLYNRERLSISKDANAKLAAAPGGMPSRTRQTPCPTDTPSSGSDGAAGASDSSSSHAARVTQTPSLAAYYPDEARRSASTGRVLLRLDIDETGCARNFQVVESTGDPLLDDAALRYAEAMRFRPATADGKPKHSSPELPVKFALAD